MRRYDPGDKAALRHTVVDEDGTPTDATVAFTYTPPGGDPTPLTPTHGATGVYDVLVPAPDYGVYSWVWSVSGTIVDFETGKFYVADNDSLLLPPLASFDLFVRKLGYTPTGPEADRAGDMLDAASTLIRDLAAKTWVDTDTGALQDVPRRVARVCVESAYRAFGNPEALTQRGIGDSNKSFDRAKREGGEAVYLTKREEDDVLAAAGSSTFAAITLVSPYSADQLLDPWVEA
jgi:hypothetical protein